LKKSESGRPRGRSFQTIHELTVLLAGNDELKMPYLDWIKNRGKQQAVSPKPQTQENAKQRLTREVAKKQTPVKQVEQIPEGEKATVKGLEERIVRAQPAANSQQQTPESEKPQTSRDRVFEALERAQGSRLSPTPDQTTDGVDPARLARAERFVDASARPKREEPPPMRWPRPRGSWER
jgi:hypothetical protein